MHINLMLFFNILRRPRRPMPLKRPIAVSESVEVPADEVKPIDVAPAEYESDERFAFSNTFTSTNPYFAQNFKMILTNLKTFTGTSLVHAISVPLTMNPNLSMAAAQVTAIDQDMARNNYLSFHSI